MPIDPKLKRARMVSSVAATLISLACGTNYVYSAWAPQFADKLHLTTTQSNYIGLAGNLGMYLVGVPIGLFIDNIGPRPGVILGSFLLGLGYVPLASAYDKGSGSIFMLCVFSFLTGLGGCIAFQASIKTSALNWPNHRGTATAFPLAAFGLSAFFFSLTGSVLFPGNTSSFLRLLAAGTFFLTFGGFFFLHVTPENRSYHAVPNGLTRSNSQQLHRTSSEDGKGNRNARSGYPARTEEPDIRGWRLLADTEFWQLFAIMCILAGIGLMTINNIGHDVNALWKRYNSTVTEKYLIAQQQIHVSLLSFGSFGGRLLSGIGSDFLVKRMGASRVWCLVVASLVFTLAQLFAINLTNPQLLATVSGFSGLGYGLLFGVFPSIVAETFGIHGLSQNWGFMTLAPAVSGNIFNLIYGSVFDKHTIVDDDGNRSCPDGIDCYRDAYYVTLGACALGLLTTLYTIRHQYVKRQQEDAKVIAVD